MSERAQKYAEWLVSNQDKQGTPEFQTVAEAYKLARQQTAEAPVQQAPVQEPEPEEDEGFLSSVGEAIGDAAEAVADDPLGVAGDVALGVAGFVGDVVQGTAAGVVNIPQGLAETGALALDFAAGTNTVRAVEDFNKATDEVLGLTPDSATGKTVEQLVTYGATLIPAVGFLSRASTVARGGSSLLAPATRLGKSAEKFGASKAGKALLGTDKTGKVGTAIARAKLGATTSLTGGAVEILISPDGTGSLADSFHVLPDALQTEADSGLQGRDETNRRIRNKLRKATEATAIGGALELSFPALGIATRQFSKIPGIDVVARGIPSGFASLAEHASNAPIIGGAVKKTGEVLGRHFSSTQGLPDEMFEVIQGTKNMPERMQDEAVRLFKDFDKNARKVLNSQKIPGRGQEGLTQSMDDLLAFLEGDIKALDKYAGKDGVNATKSAAVKMRAQLDGLTAMAADGLREGIERGTVSAKAGEAALREMEHNAGSYLRRLYEGAFDLEATSILKVKEKQVYKDAVESYANDLMKYKKYRDNPQAARDAAEKRIDGFIVKGGLDDNLSPTALAKFQNDATKAARSIEAAPMYKTAEELFAKRSKFLSRNKEVRALLNEVRDPKELYMRTVSDLASFVGADRMYRNFAKSAKTYPEAVKMLNAAAKGEGQKPLIIQGLKQSFDEATGNPVLADALNKEQIRTLRELGYKQVGDVANISGKGKKQATLLGQYGDLTGSYVAPEVYNAITIPARSNGFLSDALAISLQLKGVSQMSKTVLNTVSQIRNFASGTFMVGANGNLPRDAALSDAFRLTFKKINGLSDPDKDAYFRMIGELGLVDENLAVNEMKMLLRETEGVASESLASGITSKIDKIPGVAGLQQIYSDTDTFWKVVGFQGEKAKYSSAFRAAGLDPDKLSASQFKALRDGGLTIRSGDASLGQHSFLDVMSADIVKRTMPIYSRVPNVIKGIRKIPVMGNFVAFPAEIIRNSSNILGRGLDELGFKAVGKNADGQAVSLIRGMSLDQAQALQREIRAIGMNRLTSYTANAFAIPKMMQSAGLKMTGTTEEEFDAIKRANPDYTKGHNILMLSKPDKNGDYEYIDLSYTAPYDYAFAPVQAAIDVFQQEGELTDNGLKRVAAAAATATAKYLEPFASESLLTERVADVTLRQGRTQTGAPVYEKGENVGDIMAKSASHVLAGLTPTMVSQFIDFSPQPEATRLGPIGVAPGRVSRAFTETPSGSGRMYNVDEEALANFTGTRISKGNIKQNLTFEGYEFSNKRTSALSVFTRTAKNNATTEQQIVDSYVQANENLLRHQRKMYQFIKDARTLGYDDDEIATRLNERGNIGKEELDYLLSGEFRPASISDKLFQDIFDEVDIDGKKRVVEDLPEEALFDIYERLDGQSLDVEIPDEEAEETPILGTAAPATPPAGAQAGAGAAPSSAPAPVTPAQPAATAAPVGGYDPSKPASVFNRPPADLLGSDPVSQAKNQQLLGR